VVGLFFILNFNILHRSLNVGCDFIASV
jgi:hypothetical protein